MRIIHNAILEYHVNGVIAGLLCAQFKLLKQFAPLTQFELRASLSYLPVMAVLTHYGNSHQYRIVGTDVTIPHMSENTLYSATDGWFVHRHRLYQIRAHRSSASYGVSLVCKNSDGITHATSMSAGCSFGNGTIGCCLIADSNIQPILCDDHYAYPAVMEGQIRIVRIYIDQGRIEIGEPFTPAGYSASVVYAAWDSAHSRLHLFATRHFNGCPYIVDISDANYKLRMRVIGEATYVYITIYDNIAYVSSIRHGTGRMFVAYDIVSCEPIPSNLPQIVRPAGGSLVSCMRESDGDYDFMVIDLRTGDEYVFETHAMYNFTWHTPWTIMSSA